MTGPTFWIVGSIAWDHAMYIDHIPVGGRHVQARPYAPRPGGAGANTAVALASSGESVCMVGYVGADPSGASMMAFLGAAGIDLRHVVRAPGHTSEVVLLIEPDGERSMIGLYPDMLEQVPIPVEQIQPGDIVFFSSCRPTFLPAMDELSAKGVTVASVPRPGLPPVDLVIGSRLQCHEPMPLARVATVITEGSSGVSLYRDGRQAHFPAQPVEAVDATGAGDAFAAGFLHRVARGDALERAVAVGQSWAAAVVQERQSHLSAPPRPS